MATEPAIGTSIKRARERKRWSQRQLADAIGVNIKSVDNWENDRTYPRSSIGALEDVLGIKLDGAPEPEPEDDWERWERAVLSNPAIPAETARAIVTDANLARDAHLAAAARTASASREAPSSPPQAAPSARTAGRHRAAG